MSAAGQYGSAPIDLGPLDLEWDEFMHYLYLPVRIPARDGSQLDPGRGWPVGVWAEWDDEQELLAEWGLPPRLWFLRDTLKEAVADARRTTQHLADPYVYVTARRGYATPGNPLNRPGWHCDDFGGTDLNYIWSDTYPTRFLRSTKPLTLPEDDQQSMMVMGDFAHVAENMDHPTLSVEDGPVGHLLRLDPFVIHDTPIIPAPGGMRSFFKISVSSHRYNLRGNSRNHLLDYDWPMCDRDQLRNQPQVTNRDDLEPAAS